MMTTKISKPTLAMVLFFCGFFVMAGVAPLLMMALEAGSYQEWYVAIPLGGMSVMASGLVVFLKLKESDF